MDSLTHLNHSNQIFLSNFAPERFQAQSSSFFFLFYFFLQRALACLAAGLKDLALLTSANVNKAIPPQLETLNALDSVQYQGFSMQLMQPQYPTSCFEWLGWLRGIQFQFKASHWKPDWAGWIHHESINTRLDGCLVVGVFFGSVMEKSSNWTDLSEAYVLRRACSSQGRKILKSCISG